LAFFDVITLLGSSVPAFYSTFQLVPNQNAHPVVPLPLIRMLVEKSFHGSESRSRALLVFREEIGNGSCRATTGYHSDPPECGAPRQARGRGRDRRFTLSSRSIRLGGFFARQPFPHDSGDLVRVFLEVSRLVNEFPSAEFEGAHDVRWILGGTEDNHGSRGLRSRQKPTSRHFRKVKIEND